MKQVAFHLQDTDPRPSGGGALARALALEVSRLERLRMRAWQALSIAIVVGALSLAAARGAPGLGSAAVGIVSLLWFTFVRAALTRGRWSTPLALITVVVEQTVPWAIFVAVLIASGAEQATRVWGPPLVYTGMLILTTLKLSPRYSVISGVLGAAQYLALSFFVVRPRLGPGVLVEATDSGGDVVRAFMLMIGGLVVAVVAHGLRTAVGGVVSILREQDLFGKYRLEREVAAGGMGVVWLATYCPEGGFARAAAVKLVHAHLSNDQAFVDAFRHEAELCARLVHQNIVQVFDFGRVDERYFLAMEYVDGFTLRDVLRRAAAAGLRVPPVVAGAIARQILAGLHFSHSEAHDNAGQKLRVIHRDLAPSNILLSHGGEVKLTDFGIARALRDGSAAKTATLAGHFDHMAPEQAAAGALDERTDLFCVGILLWEMLTGAPLFRRGNDAATLHAVAHAPIAAPSTVDGSLAPFDALCAKALARDRTARFQSARDMAEAIREATGAAAPDAITTFLAALPAPSQGSTGAAAASESLSSTTAATGGASSAEPTVPGRPPGERDTATTLVGPARIADVDDVNRDTTILDGRSES
ncbi:MAG: serine/threonine protein kinase [Deltaproteobacteria bacterium]|nr:serine/threonine protein kinase [Deltaproteobacteria bacterium]